MASCAIQIVSSDGEDSFDLDEDALRKILANPQIKDKPACVISIAGAFRQGKSFFLNFLLRYLKLEKDAESFDVMDFLDAKYGPLEGFSWRFGRERHTIGLLMWSEIFVIKDQKGSDVAVILLDTQGTFDNLSTYNNCATVFALGTLISSVQIYNLMQNIKQDDLNHLQCFAEYGKWIKSEEAPFQKLLFLVRDWQWPDDNEYGFKGGSSLLDSILDTSGNLPSEVKAQRKNIKELFTSIECFLMPKPGDLVSENKSFVGNISDIDVKFLEHVKKLVPFLLQPSNLIIKQVNGEKITAGGLIHYIKAYVNRFQNEDKPQIKSVYMATVEANYMVAVDKSVTVYKNSMENAVNGKPYLEDNELETKHMRAELEAMRYYQKKEKMGNVSRMNEKYQRYLEQQIQELWKNYQTQNKIKQENELIKMKQQHEDAVRNSLDTYSLLMEEIFNEFVFLEEDDLKAKHQECEKGALSLFDDKTKNSPQDIRIKCLGDLQQQIDNLFKKYEMSNKGRGEKAADMDELKSENAVIKSVEMYKQFMEESVRSESTVEEEDFLNHHKNANNLAIEYFENETKGCQERIKRKYLSDFKARLDGLFKHYVELNKEKLTKNSKFMELKLENTFTNALNKYKRLMEMKLLNDIGESSFLKSHREIENEVLEFFQMETEAVRDEFRAPYIRKLQQNLNEMCEDLNSKRCDNLSLSHLKHEYALRNTIEKYKQNMDRVSYDILSDEVLNSNHKKAEENVLNFYENEMRGVIKSQLLEEFLNEVKSQVENTFMHYVKKNKEKEKAQMDMFVERAIETYSEQMSEYLKGDVDPKRLKQEHRDAMEEAMTVYEAICEDKDEGISLQYSKVLKKRINELFKEYKTKNSDNDSVISDHRNNYETVLTYSENIYKQAMTLGEAYLEIPLIKDKHQMAKDQATGSLMTQLHAARKEKQDYYLKRLENNIESLLFEYIQQNEAQLNQSQTQNQDIPSKIINESITIYKRMMDELLGSNKYYKDDRIRKEHEAAMRKAVEDCKEKIQDMDRDVKHSILDTLEQKLNGTFGTYKDKNKSTREFIKTQEENKCLRAIISTQKLYRLEMAKIFTESNYGSCLDSKQLQLIQDEAGKTAVEHYKKNSSQQEHIKKQFLPEIEEFVAAVRVFPVIQVE